MPTSGKHVETDTSHWTRVGDGRVVEAEHHIDLMGIRTQVGALG